MAVLLTCKSTEIFALGIDTDKSSPTQVFDIPPQFRFDKSCVSLQTYICLDVLERYALGFTVPHKRFSLCLASTSCSPRAGGPSVADGERAVSPQVEKQRCWKNLSRVNSVFCRPTASHSPHPQEALTVNLTLQGTTYRVIY